MIVGTDIAKMYPHNKQIIIIRFFSNKAKILKKLNTNNIDANRSVAIKLSTIAL